MMQTPSSLGSLHQKALAHFLSRLESAHVDDTPYPHFYIDNVFPDDYYERMRQLLPTTDAYKKWTDVGKVKLEQYSRRDQCYLEPEWLNAQPPVRRDFWNQFSEWFLGNEVVEASMKLFRPTLEKRFGSGEEGWPDVFPQAIFLRHRADYFIGPHTDIPSKVVNILFYLPGDNENEHLGTSMFVPKEEGFVDPGTRHFEFEDFTRVKIAPYRRNAAFGFVKDSNSWHGVEPIDETSASRTPRDVIQYMIYDNPMRAPRKNQTTP